jgi:ribosomal protein L11 methyltransferase
VVDVELLSVTASPALILRFPSGTTAPVRDRLVALLSEFELLAVQEDDIDAPHLWTAHFASVADRDAAADAVGAESEFERIEVETATVEHEDWARRTQADLPAVKVGRVIVAPPWDLPEAPDRQVGRESDVVVIIEPSRGFGTGHHQSTRLCLVLLQSRDLSRSRVLDVGTGSGVLAITAAKLGAPTVTAIDNDPDAIENARENIAANGVDSVVQAHVVDFTTTTVDAADLVTANLTGTLLARHASELARLVRPGGTLIASGFNIEEKHFVEEALTPLFHIVETAEEEGWWALALARR